MNWKTESVTADQQLQETFCTGWHSWRFGQRLQDGHGEATGREATAEGRRAVTDTGLGGNML